MPDPAATPSRPSDRPSRRHSKVLPAIVDAARAFIDHHPNQAVAVILGVPTILAVLVIVLAIGAPEAVREFSASMRDSTESMADAMGELRRAIDANTEQINSLQDQMDRLEHDGDDD